MVWTIGNPTKSTFYQGPESHKLYIEFEADGDIHVGQPVVLHADGNKVTAASASSLETDIIGISIIEKESAYGDFVTIAMKGYAVVNCKAVEVFDAGGIVYAGYDTSDAYTGTQQTFGGYNLVGNTAGNDVAQVDTLTVAGTGGTLDVTYGGLTKTVTFDTSLDITTDNFRVANAAAYLALTPSIILTDVAATLVFTAAVAGTPIDNSDFATANQSDDLTAVIVHTTPNSVAGNVNRIWGWAMDAAAAVGTIVKVIVKN